MTRRLPRDVLGIIFQHVDDSVTWCNLSQINRAARLFGKQLLRQTTFDVDENLSWRGSDYRCVLTLRGYEICTVLPCGTRHGRAIYKDGHEGDTPEPGDFTATSIYISGQCKRRRIWLTWKPSFLKVTQMSILMAKVKYIDGRVAEVCKWSWETEDWCSGGIKSLLVRQRVPLRRINDAIINSYLRLSYDGEQCTPYIETDGHNIIMAY